VSSSTNSNDNTAAADSTTTMASDDDGTEIMSEFLGEMTIHPIVDQESPRRWKSAIDPASGSIYYYDVVTRQSQWAKPPDYKPPKSNSYSPEEQKQREFFKRMEKNILQSLSHGRIPGSSSSDDKECGRNGPKKARESSNRTGTSCKKKAVRTISNMDESVLAELTRLEQEDVLFPDTSTAMGSSHVLPSGHENGGLTTTTAQTGHVRRNSGFFVSASSSLSVPNRDATIKCICAVYWAHILHSACDKNQRRRRMAMMLRSNVFYDRSLSERIEGNCSSYGGNYDRELSTCVEHDKIPSLEEITTFFIDIFQKSQMEVDGIIVSLIYAERVIKESGGCIRPTELNWRSILLCCMMLASKVWDDLSMINVDFSNISETFSLRRINQLELEILKCLDFNVSVSASEYAKYYFLLRSVIFRSALIADGAQCQARYIVNASSGADDSQIRVGVRRAWMRNRRVKSLDDYSCIMSASASAVNTLSSMLPTVCLDSMVCS